nr:TrmH family RNA methyltransferase [Candidatus Sigynarchaeota archaeon]
MDVLVVEPKTAGNVGFIARCMQNFGAGKLMVLNPAYNEDIEDMMGFAMHGRSKLQEATIIKEDRAHVARMLATLCKNYEIVACTTAKPENPQKLHRVPVTPKEAAPMLASPSSLLVLGREDAGLTDEELILGDITIAIPASPEYPTLNVSHAAAIIMYEWHTLVTQEGRGSRVFSPAPRDQRQAFHEWMEQVIIADSRGVTEDWRAENFVQAMKNVVERANISQRELDVLFGYFRTYHSRKKK